MIAKEDTRYVQLVDGKVFWIFTSKDLPEWCENGVDNIDEDGNIIHPYAITTIELTDENDNVAVGDIYNPTTHSFTKPIIEDK